MHNAARPSNPRRAPRPWPALAVLALLVSLLLWDAQAPPARQWLNRGGLAAIAGYQQWARPAVRRICVCRLHPSCSEYTRQALAAQGFWPGAWAGARRILSCRPSSREDQPRAPHVVAHHDRGGTGP